MYQEEVVVDFQPQPDVISETRASLPEIPSGGWLEIEGLNMPFVFRVGGVDLIPRGRTWWQPLIYMARIPIWFIRRLETGRGDFMQFAMGGGVYMRRDDDRVSLSPLQPTGQAAWAETSYSALLDAWEESSERIRRYLLRELPDLADDPDLAPWFRGEED